MAAIALRIGNLDRHLVSGRITRLISWDGGIVPAIQTIDAVQDMTTCTASTTKLIGLAHWFAGDMAGEALSRKLLNRCVVE